MGETGSGCGFQALLSAPVAKSNAARLALGALPTFVNCPPRYSVFPELAKANTPPSMSGFHEVTEPVVASIAAAPRRSTEFAVPKLPPANTMPFPTPMVETLSEIPGSKAVRPPVITSNAATPGMGASYNPDPWPA